MVELRTHLVRDEFVERVARQRVTGYHLVYAEEAGQVRAVAGYRVLECLAWGRFLYVDDLVTRAADGRRGYGGRLLTWLTEEARRQGCAELHLDSGVQRFDAHRFYLKHGLDITCHHFGRRLDGPA
jgi:GNAT superfamily N-acetyltransferase